MAQVTQSNLSKAIKKAQARTEMTDALVELGIERARINGALGENTRKIKNALPGALDAGVPVAEAARLTGISRPTLYQLLDR